MNDWYLLLQLEKQRHTALLRQADAYRLSHPALDSTQAPLKAYQRWLNQLGVYMVLWGCRLQSRYEPLALSSLQGEFSESQPEPCTS